MKHSIKSNFSNIISIAFSVNSQANYENKAAYEQAQFNYIGSSD